MSDACDDVSEMPTPLAIDDATAEAVLSGECTHSELDALVEVVAALRAVAEGPVQPTRVLAELMASGNFTRAALVRADDAGAAASAATTMMGRTLRTGRSKLAAMSLRTKVAAGLAVAVTGMTGVTAAGALPDAAEDQMQSIIEAVTPITFADEADFGQDVAEDARDGGVDGQEVSEKAKENGHQPEAPEQSQADEHKPTITPGTKPTDLPTPDGSPPDARVDAPGADIRPDVEPGDAPDEPPVDPQDPLGDKEDNSRPAP